MSISFNEVIQELKSKKLNKDAPNIIIVKKKVVINKLPMVKDIQLSFSDELQKRCKMIKLRKIQDDLTDIKSITENNNIYNITYCSGDKYRGTLTDENEYLKGQVKTKTGYIIEGHFSNGFLNGEGKFVKTDTLREGIFVNNMLNGKGKYVTKNKNTYEGEFKDDYLVQGTLTYPSGLIYEGKFKNNILIISTKIIFVSGNQINGNFKDLNEKSMLVKNMNLDEWSTSEVLYWVKCYNSKYYNVCYNSFKDHNIDGYLFRNLIEKDYISLDIPRYHLRILLEKRDLFLNSRKWF